MPATHLSDQATTRQQLQELPELLALTAGFKLPGSTPPDPDQPTTSRNPARPPLRVDVVDLLDDRPKDWADDPAAALADWLEQPFDGRRLGAAQHVGAWAMLVHMEMLDSDLTVDRGDDETVLADVAFLVGNLAWVIEHHHDFQADIRRLHQDLERATGTFKPAQRLFCLKEGCGNELEVSPERQVFTCLGCGKAWGWMEVHRMAPKPLAELAITAKCSVRTLQRWAAKGLIQSVSVDDRTGDRLFRPSDVRRVRAETQATA